MSEWKPIESAPKTGRLLAVVDGLVRVIAWGKTSHVPMYGWCLADQGPEDFDLCKPLLWMPMPAVPTISTRYDATYGDDKVCECGHPYYRHFDTYDGMAAVGCKYCDCTGFRLPPPPPPETAA